MTQFSLFSGTSHPSFCQKIAARLNISLGKAEFAPFPDGEISIQILENVRGKDVFLVQSLALKPNDYLMELLILIDAVKRASAKSITAVLPYFCYARQDRKDRPRVPITAKLVANLLTTAGVDHVVTMDLHAGQIQGFFDIPVDNLFARPVLAEAIKNLKLKNLVVMAPDLGAIKKARDYADHLKCEYALIDKRRLDKERVEVNTIIGDVSEKEVVLVDDMCSTGGTLVRAAEACKAAGAKKIYAAFTHALFSKGAIEKLATSPIEQILTTDTIPFQGPSHPKIQIFSVAPLFGQAIERILTDHSLSSIFSNT